MDTCRIVQMPKKSPRKRVKIKGHYYRVRQGSTKKAKKEPYWAN
jgi:hypothetical protein